MPASDAWSAYTPSDEAPWDLRRVVHLHRRAGFAATWGEIRRDLEDGPAKSIDRLLTGTARGQYVPADFERVAASMADAALGSGEAVRLKGWWAYRMLFGPDPLTERLTLLWHNHFATSNLKVADLRLMHRQNETLRKHARAAFGAMLGALLRDPALLYWLDAPANRKEHPNENLGRELLELFTLGIGNYGERDVKEAARALTGWTVEAGAFRDVGATHDRGEKTILGHKGAWKGEDLLRILLEHPATGQRLAVRLCEQFFGEGAALPADIAALADRLRRDRLDIGKAVETILRSRAFFAEKNLRTRVLGPAEYVIGAARALEVFEPPPSTVALADWIGFVGQDLFYPPNVFGWPGGRRWLDTRSVVHRTNFAAELAAGTGAGRAEPLDALGLAKRHGRGGNLQEAIDFFAQLLFGTPPSAEMRTRLGRALPDKTPLGPQTARRAVVLILASPPAQLG
jgi:uncharacterized protein (DUF1800 family)